MIQISDTGIGIAPEDIPMALAPFGQIDSDLNRRYEGTGLGLPLTKSLVEIHGGSLDLQGNVKWFVSGRRGQALPGLRFRG